METDSLLETASSGHKFLLIPSWLHFFQLGRLKIIPQYHTTSILTDLTPVTHTSWPLVFCMCSSLTLKKMTPFVYFL